MNPGRILRAGITASAVAHLSILMLVLFFTEVHPYGSVTAEPITVDIVSPAEAPPDPKNPDPKKEEPVPEPKAKPSETLDLPSKSEAASAPAASPPPPAAQQPPAAPPQRQTAMTAPSSAPQPAGARPQPPTASPSPGYTPPEPDLSIKYHVMLGLPPDLPVEPAKGAKDDYDAQASKKADIDSGPVAEFRRHLKACSKLPPSISPSDSVMIRLRVFMTPDGKLSADPVVLEGSGNLKGLDLRQSAIDALQACQPYKMLPPDRYGEWNVLDLTFTPQDFAG
ncbi:hypothetical protein [Bradyrhizobium sp.]|uniref:hypothetical protein n=1 Tax=Bradyrhizobium sp. TaxID=376 RepID=UPI0025BB1BB6|nr:hypothetical protein [Bradyrhizobium sp.]